MITVSKKSPASKPAALYPSKFELTTGGQLALATLSPEQFWGVIHPYEHVDPAPDYQVGDALRAVTMASLRTPRVDRSARMSRKLALRLKQIVAWAPGWDGGAGKTISPEVAQKVEDLIMSALAEGAPEPTITVASDGSLAVDWHLADQVVGLFVDSSGNLEPAAIMTASEVREVPINSEEDLLSILRARLVRDLAPA